MTGKEPFRALTPANSEYNEAAVEECRNVGALSATGEIPITVDWNQ
jgi:hypothetical protein